MAIVKMKRLRLAAMRSDREALLRLLQTMGCVEVEESSLAPEERDRMQLRHSNSQGLAVAQEQKTAAERALEVLKRYAPEKNGFLTPKPSLTTRELLDEAAEQQGLAQTRQINEKQQQLQGLEGQAAKINNQLEALTPWESLDVALNTQSTKQVIVQFGTLPAEIPVEQMEQEVLQAGELAQLMLASSDRNQHYILLICHSNQAESVLEVLKENGWSRLNLRTWTGTAKENIRQLRNELEQIEREKQTLEQALSAMGGSRRAVEQYADRSEAQVKQEQCRERLLDTQHVFFLEGWIPEKQWSRLEEALKPYPAAVEVCDPTEEEYPQVPVKLENNWFTRPLNMVTEMYSLPAYGSLDPNPLMAPFFILFYGIMMADMGYGLVMFLLGALVLWKKKPSGTFAHLCGLLVLCGVSTFVMGALTGGFFGDFLPQLLKLINPNSTFALPALFTPLEDTMMILIGAMALGVVQILTGMAISFIRKIREGKILDAVWEEVTWWVVMLGLVLTILGVTNLVLIVGGIMVVVGSGWNATGFGKVTAVFGSLYNHVTGYFGDILSYSRLMALMLAGSVIAQVFNTLGAIPGNVILFLIISFAGNTLNFALNLLGCYVHDLRLQCLEYFNKFYEDGGKPFRPLDFKTRYYDVVK